MTLIADPTTDATPSTRALFLLEGTHVVTGAYRLVVVINAVVSFRNATIDTLVFDGQLEDPHEFMAGHSNSIRRFIRPGDVNMEFDLDPAKPGGRAWSTEASHWRKERPDAPAHINEMRKQNGEDFIARLMQQLAK